MPKPAPEYDIGFVLHPEQDATYIHFENAATNPFQPNPSAMSRVNAWWLSEAALLSYWDPAPAIQIFKSAGLDAEYVNQESTDCYVAWESAVVIVAFRGTESDQWKDILTDARVAQIPWKWSAGQVHVGFAAAVEAIWPKLTLVVDKLAQTRTVWFCGHSLGAALATLAADRYARSRGVCTFGSPRVGSPAFAAAFTQKFVNKTLRFVNDHDVVTHVPPPILGPWMYRHVDPRRFIDAAGQISDGAPMIPHFFGELVGSPEALLDIIRATDQGAIGHPPMFLLDHMPKAYATWIWNDYEANG